MNAKEFVRQPATIFVMLWGILCVVVYTAIDQETELFDWVSYVFYLGSAVISSAVLLYVFRFYGMKSFEGKVWLYMSIGIILWTVAEFVYFYYYMIRGEDPFPSPADAFYLAGYAPVILAIFYKAMYAKPKFDLRKFALIFTFLLAITLPTVIYVFNPVMSDTEYDATSKMVSVAYPILDLILLPLALAIALYWGTQVSKGWYLVAAGIMMMTIADIIFTSIEWSTGEYYTYLDLLWIAQYLLFAAGALYQKKIHESFL